MTIALSFVRGQYWLLIYSLLRRTFVSLEVTEMTSYEIKLWFLNAVQLHKKDHNVKHTVKISDFNSKTSWKQFPGCLSRHLLETRTMQTHLRILSFIIKMINMKRVSSKSLILWMLYFDFLLSQAFQHHTVTQRGIKRARLAGDKIEQWLTLTTVIFCSSKYICYITDKTSSFTFLVQRQNKQCHILRSIYRCHKRLTFLKD